MGRSRSSRHLVQSDARITGKKLGTDRVEDRAIQERCIVSDSMFVPTAFYNNYHRIVQAPGYVVMVSEHMGDTRVIPLDRRPPGRGHPAVNRAVSTARR